MRDGQPHPRPPLARGRRHPAKNTDLPERRHLPLHDRRPHLPPPPDKTDFTTDQAANHGTPVPGIGTAAFTYGHKGRVISLEVLDRNTTFIISGSSAGLPHIKQLAERMVPLI
jgi:hypothetical protein